MILPEVGKQYVYVGQGIDVDLFSTKTHLERDTNLEKGQILTCEKNLLGNLHFLTSDGWATEYIHNFKREYDMEWHELFVSVEDFNATLSIYHVADILEDALVKDKKPSILYERKDMYDTIEMCIKTLRDGGY